MPRARTQLRPDRVHRVEIVGELDAHAAEEFALEIRRLAKQYGSEVRDVLSTRRWRAEKID